LAVLFLAVISYIILFGLLWILAAFDKSYHKIAVQMGLLWTVYDTALMLFNAFTFCLACSLYICETRKKGVMSMLANYYSKLKKGQCGRSKQLLSKDINYVDLAKHLFIDVDNIE
jgi:hypothetical protein